MTALLFDSRLGAALEAVAAISRRSMECRVGTGTPRRWPARLAAARRPAGESADLSRPRYVGDAPCHRFRLCDRRALWADRSAALGPVTGWRPGYDLGGNGNHPASRQCLVGERATVHAVSDWRLRAAARQLKPMP
jgi:hypothetical protein